MILLDTDVMVDVMRRHPPATDWLALLGTEAVGIPGLVAMELVQGCRDRREEQQVEAILRPYVLYWPTQSDCARAFDDFTAYHLSHGIGVLDALIAETAMGLGVELATFNDRHYRVVSSLRTIRPYARKVVFGPARDRSADADMDWQAVLDWAPEKPELSTKNGKPFWIARASEASVTFTISTGRQCTVLRSNLEKAVRLLRQGETLNGPSDYRQKVADDGPTYAWALLRELDYLE